MVIAEETVAALRRAGHEAEIFETPTNRFGRQFDAYEATRLTDVSEGADGRAIDQIITMRYPAFALRHPRHSSPPAPRPATATSVARSSRMSPRAA